MMLDGSVPDVVTVRDIAAAINVTERGVRKRSQAESWPHRVINARGDKVFSPDDLPEDILAALRTHCTTKAIDSVFAAARESAMPLGDPKALADRRLPERLAAVREAERCSTRRCLEGVAEKYQVHPATLYRWMKAVETKGMSGLAHGNLTRERQRYRWDRAALEYLAGLYLRRENRKIDFVSIYRAMAEEAARQGWRYGSLSSARQYIGGLPAPLIAYRDGGRRGLDNALPPILRDYADLHPFQIIVGDQHRFDCWVLDDDDAELFRPEGYVWQDLRTRTIYGISVARKYNAQVMGHALWVGLRIYGAFDTVYTDHGAPELSKYFLDRSSHMTLMGMRHGMTEDIPLPSDADGPSGVLADLGADRRLAIVKNAKAKLIERTFSAVEGVLRSRIGVPGTVAPLGGDIDRVDIDRAEIKRLASQGKLLRFSEFCAALVEACDYYNKDREHRGLRDQLLRSGVTPPSPCTPRAELMRCVRAGWRPRYYDDATLDMIFLSRVSRVVDRGRIRLNNRIFEAPELAGLAKAVVECRYDPMDPDRPIIVMQDGRYICDATPVAYSSMIDRDITEAKISEKRRMTSTFVEQWRRFTKAAADLRRYSLQGKPIALADQAAIRTEVSRQERIAERGRSRVMPSIELQDACDRIAVDVTPPPSATEPPQPMEVVSKPDPTPSVVVPTSAPRPTYFRSDYARYVWCQDQILSGVELTDTDQGFVAAYEAKADPESLEVFREQRRLFGMN